MPAGKSKIGVSLNSPTPRMPPKASRKIEQEQNIRRDEKPADSTAETDRRKASGVKSRETFISTRICFELQMLQLESKETGRNERNNELSTYLPTLERCSGHKYQPGKLN